MTRPRILPHVAVIAALITAVLPLTTLLDSGWFGASIAIVIAIVAAGYAGRWSNALLAIALQALTWFIGVWWAYPGRLGDLIGLDGWGVPRVLESAGAQIMTSVAPVDAGAPLRFALVGAIGLLTILVDATANAWRMPLVAAFPLAAVFIAPQLAVPRGDHLLYAVAFAIALLLLIAARGSGARRRRSHVAAIAIALVAACVAIVVAPAVPFAPTTGVSLYARPTSVDVSIELGDDLRNRSNVEVMQVRTNLAAAPYLRLATHTLFDEDGWHVDSGASEPLEDGFDAVDVPDGIETVGRTTWVDGADGDWHGMSSNGTARTSSGTTQGIDYSARSVDVLPEREQFEALRTADAPAAALDVPDEVANGVIGSTALTVTADARTPYDRAIALQSWLRSSEFAYSLDTPVTDGFDGSDAEAVETFLEVREGYCVHFASAFTLMARSLGLPTRIAVGYLPGTATGDRVEGRPVYSVTADRLHAWPEVYFDDIGWTQFEPTPAIAQAQNVTATDPDDAPEPDDTAPSAPAEEQPRPEQTESETPTPTVSATEAAPTPTLRDDASPWWILVVVSAVVVLGAIPWATRRVIRASRLAAASRGDAIVAWRELVAMVDDARIPRNPALSERALARALLADPSALGSPAPERSAERPAARPAGAPRRDRAGALLALVDAVELARYSGSAAPREDLAPHLRALAGAIRPAWWGLLPRSLWRR
jgi:hypothetical protein